MRRVLLVVLLALAVVPAAGALGATPRTSFTDVENEVMCVACGVPLNIAESPQADRERVLIRRLIAQGLTKQQIKDRLVAEYGPRVLATPQDSGFGLTAYLVPIAAVLAALALLVVMLPRWRRARAAATASSATTNGHAVAALTPEDSRRLEEDLARYDV